MGVVFFCDCMSVGIQKVAEGSFCPGVGAIIVDVGFLGYRAARTVHKAYDKTADLCIYNSLAYFYLSVHDS